MTTLTDDRPDRIEGRGLKVVSNPQNPFSTSHIEWIDAPPVAALKVYEEEAKSIVTENDSPDIPFRYSVNPYRGCFHACAYCYARPTHQYIDFGAGSDFERRLVAKVNAPELLKKAFDRPSWQGEMVVFSGITDCYQPLEASYELTRRCLSVCADYRNPVSIITKGALIQRDIDILTELHRHASVHVFMSIAVVDDDLSRKLEPGAPRPSTRFRAMRALTDAGIPVGIGVAPVIPGLTDSHIPALLTRARDLGATTAFFTLLRLPREVKEVFTTRLEEALPTHSAKVVHRIQELRDGKFNNAEFGARMEGQGPRWDAIKFLFENTCEKLGLNREERPAAARTFRRPTRQLGLF